MNDEILKQVLTKFINERNIYSIKLPIQNLSEYTIFCWEKGYIEEIETPSQKDYRKYANPKETCPGLFDYKITLLGLMTLKALNK